VKKEERQLIAEARHQRKNNNPVIRCIASACRLTSHVCVLLLFCIVAILPRLSIIKHYLNPLPKINAAGFSMSWGMFFNKTGPRRQRCSITDQLPTPRAVSGRDYPLSAWTFSCIRRPVTVNHLESAPSELSFFGLQATHQATDDSWLSV
jgi:hypothetical protein